MNSIDTRRARIEKLYDLRRKINAEIDQIAAEIDDEIAAMRRAKKAAMLAKIPAPRRQAAECGTDGGYYRHRRTLGEEACDACKLAHRVYEAQRRQRQIEGAA
jgi:hypothetical protein